MLFLIKYFHSIVALQIFLNTFIHCFFSGKQLANIETKTAVRACNFSFSGRYIMFTTDKTMGHPCEIYIYDVTDTCKFQNLRTKKKPTNFKFTNNILWSFISVVDIDCC